MSSRLPCATSGLASAELVVRTAGPEETRALGRALGARLFPGSVVALRGPLGSGKTCLVQGLAEGLGVGPELPVSPSFILVAEYQGRLPLYHLDLYRLKQRSEVDELGYREYLYGEGVAVVEWADRVPEILPEARLEVALEFAGGDARTVVLVGTGERYAGLLEGLTWR
ncbi:MAG: tRNA (adenosine(37)-N6)-threonylcarbamoyltransferase complex ATPase subunit type 1 TsaE [Deltaproteobacteria bacterium]|nr:tRNA (adenosine(37)-N6)-threonylcarbamoyltransferase complex ATPase subunit type 1 TsaE [Deltaproteobacteria bacterium]